MLTAACSFKDDVDCIEVDPKLGTNINDLINHKPEIVFICLPTPMNDDGSQNISIVKNAINEINEFDSNLLIVLKSTILPKHLKELSKLSYNLIVNPEFLREKYADEDFISSELIVFGGDKDETKYLSEFYQEHTKCTCKDHIFTDLLTASFIKYTINTFLSVKVIFFNELKELFDASGASEDWENFTKYISTDKRIGESHMQVPGHDGRLGFGGACLPKDSDAFIKYANQIEKQLILLNNAIKLNNDIRSSYNKETDREFEQNTRFRGDD